MLPTILFTPQFGPENVQHTLGNLTLENNPPVHMIFWGGNEFSNGQGGPNAGALKFFQTAQNLFNGPYLSALAQYQNSLGQVQIQSIFIDPSEPGNPFKVDDLFKEVNWAFDHLSVPKYDAVKGVTPLYVVVTPPGIMDENGDFGLHRFGDYPVVWVSTSGSFDVQANPANQANIDAATVVLSREVVGATTDPDPNNSAWGAAPSPAWPNPFHDGPVSEFEDNEARNFTYRVGGVNGNLVQSYYFDPSINNRNTPKFYIVPDGYVQKFLVNA